MDAIELFANLIAQRGKTCAGQYADTPAFRQLVDVRLIQETGVVQSICCEDCDQPHDAAVAYEDGQYGYFCPDLGFIAKDRSELVAITPDIKSFVENLADDLICKRRKSKPISGETWRVGAVETHAGDVVVHFHPVLQDSHDVNELKSALAKEVSSRFGIVITASGSLTIQPFETMSLKDIVCFNPSKRKFTIDMDIEAIVGVPQVNKGGRPSVHKANIEKIIEVRNREGRSLEGQNAEAKAIRAEYQALFPNKPPPSLSTIKTYISNS